MKDKAMQSIKFLGLTLGIALSIFAINLAVYAWTAPTATPPGGNVPAPINIGTTTQAKAGALGVGGVFTANTAVHLAVGGGNVGIGTANPQARLHMVGSNAQFESGTAIEGGEIVLRGPTDFPADNIHIDNYQGRLRFIRTNPHGAETMTILQNGNVGIGTEDPTARLDINGQIRIRGGTPVAGSVLTSDENGLAHWAQPAAAGIPTGMIAVFLSNTCPTGWTRLVRLFDNTQFATWSLTHTSGMTGQAMGEWSHAHIFSWCRRN